ncbi:MAG TPA: C80 family cysteine peptidase [Rhabdochlamydiaceae bacterium]|nr:C80 family cysteine peptidase [Rhabdochlamydiaceae bacterium]
MCSQKVEFCPVQEIWGSPSARSEDESKAHREWEGEQKHSVRFTRLVVIKDPGDQKKYDYQLIFDMRQDTSQARALAEKGAHKGISSCILPVSAAIDKEQMKPVTHRSRVYIIAHGAPGDDFLMDNKRIKKTFQNFADIFSLSSKLKEEPKDNQRVKISLVVCDGATDGDKGKKSFAEKLSKSLASKGIFAEVVARKGKSYTDSNGRKSIDKVHHKEGTKFSFITTDKDTTITQIQYKSFRC